MRVAPVGLFYRDDQRARIHAALASALATHSHPLAAIGAAAIAAAVAVCLDPSTLDPTALLARVTAEAAEAVDCLQNDFAGSFCAVRPGTMDEFLSMLASLPVWMEKPLDDALPSVAASACRLMGTDGLFATKGIAATAVPTALLVAARHIRDFETAVVEVINLGGDTDTLGAMVGAIVGARVGVAGIPDRLQAEVIARDVILGRSAALLTGRKHADWVDICTLETEWTRKEAAAWWTRG